MFATVFYHFWGQNKQLASWYNHDQKETLIANELKTLGSRKAIIAKFKNILTHNKNDAQGWYLLGRVYASDGQYQAAAKSFANANALKPEDEKIILNYAQALFFANHNQLPPKARHLLKLVLGQDPANPVAINLLATDNYMHKHYQKAKSYWQALLPYFPKDSNDREMLLAAIDKTNHQLGTIKKAGKKQIKLQVKVSLPESQLGFLKANKNNILYLYAKAIHGPIFPVAVIKKNISSLPIQLTLSNDNAMVPNATLSNYKVIKIYARLSHHDTVKSVKGDLEGKTSVISINKARQAAIVISLDRKTV